jgi:hypothetical protein
MRTIALGALIVVAAITAGCTPELRPISAEGQALIENGHGVLAHQEDITVSTAHVRYPPISSEREYIALALSVQNNGQSAILVDPNRMRLAIVAGDERIERAPINPDDLMRAYQAAIADGDERFAEVVEPELAAYVRHYGHHGYPCYGRTYYVYRPYYYGGYYAYDYYDGASEVYRRQQETASFLARLLRPQMVLKDTVVDGFVVFGQRAEKKDRYLLTVPAQVLPPGSEAVTQPTVFPPTRDVVFEFQFLAK